MEDPFTISLRSIARHEREHKDAHELAKVIESAADEIERLRAALVDTAKAAHEAEREACAQRCNSIAFLYDEGSEGERVAFACCAAIRARKGE